MMIGRFHHPIWTTLASTSLVTFGVAALWFGGPLITLSLLLYGAGIGLESVARGTLPLAFFGAGRYPILMGRIAQPSLIAQAAAPSIGAILLASAGSDGALAILAACAFCNVLLAGWLLAMTRPAPTLPKPASPHDLGIMSQVQKGDFP